MNWLCFFFHSWTNWGEVEKENWTSVVESSPENPLDGIKMVQWRTCYRCNRKERRYL